MKKNIFITFVLILILCILPVSAGVLSVSQVDYKTNNGPYAKMFLVTTTLKSSESNQIIQASKMVDSLDGVKATKDFSISTSLQETSCDYQFLAAPLISERYISTYRIKDSTTWTITKGWSTNDCYDKVLNPLGQNETVVFATRDLAILGTKVYCIMEQKKYEVGYMSQPTPVMKMSMSISNGVETQTKSILSSKENSIVFDHAVFNYEGGGLATSFSCPQTLTTGIRPVKNIGDNNFILNSETKINTYFTNQKRLKDQFSFWTFTTNSDEVKKLNDYADGIYSNKITTIQGQTTESYNVIIENANAKIITTQTPILPIATIQIDADWVGIQYLCGIPEVNIATQSISFTSGIGKTIDVNVKNIGTSNGIFNVYSDCEGDISEDSKTISLQPSSSGIVRLSFNSNAKSDVCDKCVIKVQNSQQVLNSNECNKVVTTTLNACSKPALTCEEGITSCSSNSLIVCRNNAWVTQTQCPNGCEMGYNTGKCIVLKPVNEVCNNNIDDDGDGLVDGNDPDCQVPPSKINWIILVITIILALVGAGLIHGLTSPLSSFKNKYLSILRWAITISVFVGLFILIPTIIKMIINLFTFKWW